MGNDIQALRREVRTLKNEVAVIKNAVCDEGELTDWAKKELAKARKEPESSYISHEEVKRRILSK